MSLSFPVASARTPLSSGSTIPQAFDVLFKSLSIEAARPKASKQQQTLRGNLQHHLDVVASILTGSYRRGTQIPPLDDIDVLLLLDIEVYRDYFVDSAEHTAAILQIVRRALAAAYPNSEIQCFDRCIRISFTGTGIGFDITPAFKLSEDVFAIPDTRLGRWIATNPKEHERQISYANQNVCGQWLVPLVKLLKLWNQEHGRVLTGFHLEVMAFRALQHTPENAREGLAFLFGALATAVRYRTPDPWPRGLDIDEYLAATKRERAADRLAEAAEIALAALAAEKAGDLDAAHWGWHQLFGGRYPEAGRRASSPRMLSPYEAAAGVARSAVVTATSFGLAAPATGYASTGGGTSHGGDWEPAAEDDGETTLGVEEAERQIAEVLHQFCRLQRISPAEAVLNPALWPVYRLAPDSLHAVLVGEQRTNLGRWHQILIAVPAGAPIAEAKVYALAYHSKHVHDGTGRYRPSRAVRHRWGGRSLCTHAQCDRWDGRMVTLVIWAAEWLFRQDYYQRHGVWIGAEIGGSGRRTVKGIHGGARRRGR